MFYTGRVVDNKISRFKMAIKLQCTVSMSSVLFGQFTESYNIVPFAERRLTQKPRFCKFLLYFFRTLHDAGHTGIDVRHTSICHYFVTPCDRVKQLPIILFVFSEVVFIIYFLSVNT